MDEAPFVERIFELDGDDFLVRFYVPARGVGGEFKCRRTVVQAHSTTSDVSPRNEASSGISGASMIVEGD
ncbi:hypothetical protein C5748_20120 [Phyllobacterium phragmitis]|uniref:Uncharacterized protein n=1 Tax=Phyllobacterium phragmitis TaxID=2670329 RepID=A0A2S9IMN0_9HYPH|nr:hypothetical protein [Phyllobacterium phragmitis]PRD41767.1 hypothetical protein C5748_20120 [Phyllobacterium phragmitis]